MMFWKIFEHVEPTGFCWHWTGGLNNCGYGQLGYHGTTVLAHRLIYELLVGPIPEGLQLDHLCHVRNCVNPDHLEPVTKSENMKRAGRRNGWVEGGKPSDYVPKPRQSVLTLEVCRNGHTLADVGVYRYESAKGVVVNTCLGCKKVAICKHSHGKNGCPPTCVLQKYPREPILTT